MGEANDASYGFQIISVLTAIESFVAFVAKITTVLAIAIVVVIVIQYFAKKTTKQTPKERKDDIPSWVPRILQQLGNSIKGLKPSDAAKEVVDAMWGEGSERAQKRGPGSDFNQIKKWFEQGMK